MTTTMRLELDGVSLPVRFLDCGFCGTKLTVFEHDGAVFTLDSIGVEIALEPPALRLVNHRCEVDTICFPTPTEGDGG